MHTKTTLKAPNLKKENMVLRLQYERVEVEHQKTLKGLETLNRAHKTLIRVFGSNAPM